LALPLRETADEGLGGRDVITVCCVDDNIVC